MPSKKKTHQTKIVKNKSEDFKISKTKVGELKANTKLTNLSLSYKTLKQISQNQNTAEHLLKQTTSSTAKNRKDAYMMLKSILEKTPNQLIPSRSNYLLQCIFHSLHDIDPQVFTAAAQLLSYLVDTFTILFKQYQTIFQINVKLILNQSFLDTKRVFIKEMNQNMAKLCSINQISDFAFCLQDEQIAPKIIVILIWIIEDQQNTQNSNLYVNPSTQWDLTMHENIITQHSNTDLLQQIHDVFKLKNILQPLLLKHETQFLISLLILVHYIQQFLDVQISTGFRDEIISSFPYTAGQSSQDIHESCFILNSLVYLITNIQVLENVSIVQKDRKFDLKQILNVQESKITIDVLEVITQNIVVNQPIASNILKSLITKQYSCFNIYLKLLNIDDKLFIIQHVQECPPQIILLEISKCLIRKQYATSIELIKSFIQRWNYFKINNLVFDLKDQKQSFNEIKIGSKTAYPKLIAQRKIQSVYLDAFLELLQIE